MEPILLENFKLSCTGELPLNARSGHSFIHDPLAASPWDFKKQELRTERGPISYTLHKESSCAHDHSLLHSVSHKMAKSVLILHGDYMEDYEVMNLLFKRCWPTEFLSTPFAPKRKPVTSARLLFIRALVIRLILSHGVITSQLMQPLMRLTQANMMDFLFQEGRLQNVLQ